MAERRNSLLDFFTSDTSDDLTYRSSMLPIGTYRGDDGRERAGLAWPQLALDAVDAIEAPGELLFGEGLDRDESQRRASIAAGLMMGGGLAAPRPGNALARSSRLDDAEIARQTNMISDWERRQWTTESPSGQIKAALDPDGQAVRIKSSHVNEANRGQGNGVDLYKTLIDDAHAKGLHVISDNTVSESAQHVYEALKRRGYDVRQNPNYGTRQSTGGGSLYSIPPPGFDGETLFSNGSPSTGLMSLYGYDDEYDPFLNF